MSYLERSLHSASVAETLATYNEWAQSYNEDIGKHDYIAPDLASKHVATRLGSRDIASVRILDAGCGTGLVGQHLAKLGAREVHGIDLSPKMLQIADGTGAYQTLNIGDMSQQLDIPEHSYDVIVCVGTLTAGHVGPEAFDEFVRIIKTGGLIVATVRESVWEKNGYRDKVRSLSETGRIKLVSDQLEKIGTGLQAVFVILQAS